MADITITVPDAKAPEVLDALSERWGYDVFVAELPEGQQAPTKAVFVRQRLTQYVKSEARAHMQAKAAAEAASGVTDPF